jgi:hypothetical protein
MLSGRGIRISGEQHAEAIVGFVATRIVQANGKEEAARMATRQVAQEWASGPYASKNQGGSPSLELDRSERIGFLKGFFGRKRAGYVFYSHED